MNFSSLRRPVVALSVIVSATALFGQSNGSGSEAGIPVSDPLVIAKCGSCHPVDDHGNMQRISWSRTTPEGWQDVLKDMIVMNNLSVTPAEARTIVKYLSDHNGLAPAESRPVMYEPERRVVEETGVPDTLRETCAKCHDFARARSWGRSPAEWRAFDESHSKRYRYKANAEAVAFLSKEAPLHDSGWDDWAQRMGKSSDLAGRWLVTANLPGNGQYYGEMQIDRADAEDEFTTRVTLASVKDGSKIQRSGRSALYAGSAWRGRSASTAPPPGVALPASPNSDMREVMWIAPDRQTGEGRWFWGQYQEFGFDVHLRRPPAGPALLIADSGPLKPGAKSARIRLIGANFPARIKAADLSFGADITTKKIVSSSDKEILAEVDVAPKASPGKRNVAVGKSVLPSAIVVYDRIDYIKVTPESAMAAFGDSAHPRGYQQFQAIGYQRGPDGLVHTADDVELGPVDVNWTMQVFHAPDGASSDAVGTMSDAGLLTPAATNPNLNFDVWVIATAKSENDSAGEPRAGRAYVVITVPTYAFNGRQYVRDLARWVDDGPARTRTR